MFLKFILPVPVPVLSSTSPGSINARRAQQLPPHRNHHLLLLIGPNQSSNHLLPVRPNLNRRHKLMELFLQADEAMLMAMPIVVYWLYAGLYEALSCFRGLDSYRLHSRKEEQSTNFASKAEVVKGVLLQQAIQATITLLLGKVITSSFTFLFSLKKNESAYKKNELYFVWKEDTKRKRRVIEKGDQVSYINFAVAFSSWRWRFDVKCH